MGFLSEWPHCKTPLGFGCSVAFCSILAATSVPKQRWGGKRGVSPVERQARGRAGRAGRAGSAGHRSAKPGPVGTTCQLPVSLWSRGGRRRAGGPFASSTSPKRARELLYLERRKKKITKNTKQNKTKQRRKKSEVGQASAPARHGARHATDTPMHQPVPADVIPRAAFGRQAAASHRSGLCFLRSPLRKSAPSVRRGPGKRRGGTGGAPGMGGGCCWAALLGPSPLCRWVAREELRWCRRGEPHAARRRFLPAEGLVSVRLAPYPPTRWPRWTGVTSRGPYLPAQDETRCRGAVAPRLFGCFRRKSNSHKQNEAVGEDTQSPLP